MFADFTIYNTKYNPPKILKYVVENCVFLLLWGFKMRMKMSFIVLHIWLFSFGKVLEIDLKEFVTNPVPGSSAHLNETGRW